MTDIRLHKMAQILVDHSARVSPGDRVAITAGTLAEPLVREVFELVLDRGGLPHVLFEYTGEQESLYAHASDEQLDYLNIFQKTAFETFNAVIKIRAEGNTRALTNIDSTRIARRQKAVAQLIQAQMRRGATGELRWMSTIFPTQAYAMEAEMGYQEYQDYFFRACHADDNTPDPVAYWQGVKREQERIMQAVQSRQQVTLRGPNVDLTLSIKDRKFVNACGEYNLPDGEIFTGPVEDSANGWVRFTYPAVYAGRVVEGIELIFENGRVIRASARKNQDLLLKMLDSDAGSRYLGEFAIGTNFEIDRFTRSILLDEKIGGSFHMAVGAGYPETGSVNKSVVHWDMICDLRQDSEIRMDGDLIYKNGQFTV